MLNPLEDLVLRHLLEDLVLRQLLDSVLSPPLEEWIKLNLYLVEVPLEVDSMRLRQMMINLNLHLLI
jgi:hypothetical protein